MAVSKDDILETISNMSVMEVVDLISAMEEKFGVSAAAAAVAVAPAAGGDAGAGRCLDLIRAGQPGCTASHPDIMGASSCLTAAGFHQSAAWHL